MFVVDVVFFAIGCCCASFFACLLLAYLLAYLRASLLALSAWLWLYLAFFWPLSC